MNRREPDFRIPIADPPPRRGRNRRIISLSWKPTYVP